MVIQIASALRNPSASTDHDAVTVTLRTQLAQLPDGL